MAFLKNLFSKKDCCICGGEIGLLGNRKLEDGNLCKNCAKKLSPWFSERRHSTVDQIAEQLRYREMNRDRVATFRETRSYGELTKIYIDDRMQTFMITSSRDWMKDNPDVVDYACVTDCRAEIREERSEVYHKGPDGRTESFSPRRYEYSYSFYITVYVNHPWFDDMHFSLDTYVADDRIDKLNDLVAECEDIEETMTGSRPDLSGMVHYHPPFCHHCGRDLPPHVRHCPFCDNGRAPAPAPHAPMGHAPAPAPNPGPAPRPAPHAEPMGGPQRPAGAPQRPAGAPQDSISRGPVGGAPQRPAGAPQGNAPRGPQGNGPREMRVPPKGPNTKR